MEFGRELVWVPYLRTVYFPRGVYFPPPPTVVFLLTPLEPGPEGPGLENEGGGGLVSGFHQAISLNLICIEVIFEQVTSH